MVQDFHKAPPSLQPISINGVEVDVDSTYKYLELQPDNNLMLGANLSRRQKGQHSRIHFLWRLAFFRVWPMGKQCQEMGHDEIGPAHQEGKFCWLDWAWTLWWRWWSRGQSPGSEQSSPTKATPWIRSPFCCSEIHYWEAEEVICFSCYQAIKCPELWHRWECCFPRLFAPCFLMLLYLLLFYVRFFLTVAYLVVAVRVGATD